MGTGRTGFAAIAIAASLFAAVKPAGATPSGTTGLGYWEAQSGGRVFAMGDAPDRGPVAKLAAPIVGIAALPGGQGFVLAGADGGVFTFGRARFYGSMGGTPLTRRVVGIAYTPTGRGYYLVAADGGIFTFGDATFRGSTGALQLHSPIVGMAVTPTGKGYWLVAADGGIFTFGDAKFRGSAANLAISAPVVGMAASHDGRGYWLAGRDGAIYSFGAAPYLGVPDRLTIRRPIAAIAPSPTGKGYLVMSKLGDVAAFGDASRCIRAVNNRDRESGSFATDNIGIAIPFDAATAAEIPAGSCGDLSKQFRLRSPLRVDVTRAAARSSAGPEGICAVTLAVTLPNIAGGSRLVYPEQMQLRTPGRMEVRAEQMAGGTSFRVSTSPNCIAIARPGTGGTQALPFTTSKGGDSLPFSSASPITVDSLGALFGGTTRQICRVQVLRNSDGHLVYQRQATQSHTVLPAGSFFLRSEEFGCPVTVK
jgi:hypothetical protein